MNNFAFGLFHSDDAFCALLPEVKAVVCDVRFSVLVSVTSNKVLVIVALVENVV